mmetsp:Transcript_1822/g.3315  ORF Transcript_1822/g.3315 Transcript_1822/m.3315 type:complete len:261 (-) Transcript_1822:1219-2001(-)
MVAELPSSSDQENVSGEDPRESGNCLRKEFDDDARSIAGEPFGSFQGARIRTLSGPDSLAPVSREPSFSSVRLNSYSSQLSQSSSWTPSRLPKRAEQGELAPRLTAKFDSTMENIEGHTTRIFESNPDMRAILSVKGICLKTLKKKRSWLLSFTSSLNLSRSFSEVKQTMLDLEHSTRTLNRNHMIIELGATALGLANPIYVHFVRTRDVEVVFETRCDNQEASAKLFGDFFCKVRQDFSKTSDGALKVRLTHSQPSETS